MQADFLDAHERHWQDAELLLTNQRLANADHLYGMSAECGLKRLMLAFGMTYDFRRISLLTERISSMSTGSGCAMTIIGQAITKVWVMACRLPTPFPTGTHLNAIPARQISVRHV
jgi:hypothetical protein